MHTEKIPMLDRHCMESEISIPVLLILIVTHKCRRQMILKYRISGVCTFSGVKTFCGVYTFSGVYIFSEVSTFYFSVILYS